MMFFKTKKMQICIIFAVYILLMFALLNPLVLYAGENSKKIDSKKIVRVGWYESAFCRTDSLGRRTGPIYEYQQKVSAYAGWTYEYVHGSWSELYKMLEKGEIDLLSDVSYVKERTQYVLYSDMPIGEESYYIYVKNSDTVLNADDLSSFDGKTFGVNSGTVQEALLKKWAQSNNLNIKILNTKNLSGDQFLRMLQTGELDALVRMDAYSGDYDFYPIIKLGSSEYFFAVSLKKPELLEDLNHAMAKIHSVDPNFIQKLNNKYTNSVRTSAVLSSNEKKWLETHKTISIGYMDNYLPFCSADASGELVGVLKDYTNFAEKSLSNARLSFRTVPYLTTVDLMNALRKHEVDCIFPVNLSPYDSEVMKLNATIPLLSTEIFAATKRQDQHKIHAKDPLSVALSNRQVNFDAFIKDYFPKWTVKTYDTIEDCYESVAKNDADCLLISAYRISVKDILRNTYKLSLFSTSEYTDFSFAARADDIALYSILNKTISLIPVSSIEFSLSSYSNNLEKITLWDFIHDNIAIILIISFTALIVIFNFIALHIQLKRESDYRKKIILATEHDSLTGLYNRNYFYEYAKQMFMQKHYNHYDAIVIDIEQFHTINTLLGMEFGDTVLKVLGNEIKAYLLSTDGIGSRVHADRFGIYCKHVDNYQEMYDRFQRKINTLSPVIDIQLRMGVMSWQEGIDPIHLFNRAAIACKKIQGGPKRQLMLYNEKMQERELHDRRLLSDLRRALNERQIVTFYQPKYDIQKGIPVLCSAEALVRWQHPELGLIMPNEFIPLLEYEWQIFQLDQYVWRETARQMAEWRDRYGFVLPISVNLSRVDLFDPNLEVFLDKIIKEYDLNYEDFHLEVTESAYTDEVDHIVQIVRKLRKKGFYIEMDDFGTGYSSLNLLASLPIDILKLDRSFVSQICTNDKVIPLIDMILNIAKILRVPVVAEGVEIEKELAFLRMRGCEMVQGYYFSRPLPAAEFEKKLSQLRSKLQNKPALSAGSQ